MSPLPISAGSVSSSVQEARDDYTALGPAWVGSFRAGYLNLIQMTMSQGINDEYPLTRDFLYAKERPRPVVGPPPHPGRVPDRGDRGQTARRRGYAAVPRRGRPPKRGIG